MKRILVVDDEPSIRELVAEALRDAGYEVVTAADGEIALHMMRAQRPHALVLDLMMPVLDALGLHRRMSADPESAAIPIVVMTAAFTAREIAQRIGASACLIKPFELEDLVAAVRSVLDPQNGYDQHNGRLGPARAHRRHQ